MATEVVKTVIPAGGGDYTSLSAWEAGEQKNLVTADEIAVAECYSGEVTQTLTIAGWTVDATHYTHIRAASGQEHGGLSNAGYRHTGSIQAWIDFIRVEGIVIISGTVAPDVDADTEFLIKGCVLKGDGARIIGANMDSGEMFIINNIIFDNSTSFAAIDNAGTTTITIHAYNNTVINCVRGIHRSSGTIRPKNNVVQDCSTADYAGTMTNAEANISSDATSPNTSLRNISLTFADKDGDDFHLSQSDVQAIDAAVDLSADVDYAFADDIDGDVRPSGSWDIGADEFSVAIDEDDGGTSKFALAVLEPGVLQLASLQSASLKHT